MNCRVLMSAFSLDSEKAIGHAGTFGSDSCRGVEAEAIKYMEGKPWADPCFGWKAWVAKITIFHEHGPPDIRHVSYVRKDRSMATPMMISGAEYIGLRLGAEGAAR